MRVNVPTSHRERERGQIVVIFALALVAIIAMVGLVLDGGSAFAQRRDEQSAADLAALAAANDYMLNSDTTLATARARITAAGTGIASFASGVHFTTLSSRAMLTSVSSSIVMLRKRKRCGTPALM